MPIIYGSVCSGIEAATAAWHPLGWRPAFFSEIDKFPRAVLKHHYPAVPLHGDFTTINPGDYEPIDLLVGGTPCQDFSVAGLRAGVAGDRGNLTLQFLALAQRLRPKWLVWENVPGVFSSTSHRAPDPCPPPPPLDMGCDTQEMDTEDEYDSEELHAFNCFLAGLSEFGYGYAYRVLDAQFLGVPQRRRRVFVVGYLGDWRRAAAVLFERHSLSGDSPPRREAGQGTADSVAFGLIGNGEYADRPASLRAKGGDCGGGSEHLIAKSLNAHPSRSDWETETFIAHPVPILEAGARTGKSTDDPRAGIGIGESGDPMFTLQSGKQHAIAHNVMTLAIRGRGDSHDLEYRTDGTANTILTPNGGRAGIGVGAIAFRTSPNCGVWETGDRTDALTTGTDQTSTIVAFTCKDHGADIGDIAPTLRGMGHEGSHANAGGQVAVAYGIGSDAVDRSGEGTAGNAAERSGLNIVENCQPALRARSNNSVATGMAIRRLTPRECERLQGFPDDYTAIPYRGKPAADGPRYKALGNSMAVPCMRWIGERIQLVTDSLAIQLPTQPPDRPGHL